MRYFNFHPNFLYLVGYPDLRVISVRKVAEMNKQELLDYYTHFICDAQIMSQLYDDLGTEFKSSLPVISHSHYYHTKLTKVIYVSFTQIPVDSNHLTEELARAVKCTYLRFKGKHIKVQLGHTSMPQVEVYRGDDEFRNANK